MGGCFVCLGVCVCNYRLCLSGGGLVSLLSWRGVRAFHETAWRLLPPSPSSWGHGCPVVSCTPPPSSCHSCTWKPAANLLLMGSAYLQIRPYFIWDAESDAFTWPEPLFPLPVILPLAEHCFLPCCVWRRPPLLVQRESLSPVGNNNTYLKETFLSAPVCQSLGWEDVLRTSGPVPSSAFQRPCSHLRITSGMSSPSCRGVCTCSVVIADGNY